MLGCIQPISSPMMKRMFGFCCCSCAAAGTLAAVTATNDASKPIQNFLVILMARASSVRCPKRGRQPSAVDNATNHLFAPLMVCLLARYMLASRAGPTACARKHCANSFTGLRRFKLHKGEGRAVRECGSGATSPSWPMLWAYRRAWSATNAPSFLRHGVLDRFDQLTDLKGLAQKGNATGLERLLAHAVMKMTGSMDPEPLSRRR